MSKRNFFWNMMGSGIYSLATVVFVMLAKRLIGEEAGAEFYMAFTTGQMLLTIGYFEIRPFQVTDVARQYEPGEYFGFRSITCLLMLLCGAAVGGFYLWNGKADGAGFGLIMTLCTLKMSDGMADVFEGEFQRNERIDISGKSMAFRTLGVMGAFSVAAYLTRNVYIASAVGAAAGLAGVILMALVWHRRFEPLAVSVKKDKMKEMFRSTILLFISSAMCMWIWNGTKYVVEWNLTARETLIYGIVFMPTMVINLGSGFIFKPMLTTLAKHYERGEGKEFFRLLWILTGGACGLTALTLGAGALFGIPLLSLLYAIELSEYKNVMLVLIGAGGFNAVSIIFYYALMVMRRQAGIFAGYTLTFAASVIVPVILVRNMGIMGAAVSYLLVMIFLTALFFFMICMGAKRREPYKKEEG